MRIAYCTNVRLPSERAHGHQIAQVCDALTALGHEVTIFAPFRKNPVREDFWTYYEVNRSIHLTHLGSFDPIASVLPHFLKLPILNVLLRRHLAHTLGQISCALPAPSSQLPASFDLLYTRTPALLPTLLHGVTPVILELHQLPRFGRRRFLHLARKCALVTCLTSGMRTELVRWGMQEACVHVEGDAVDLRRFANLPSIEAARQKFNIQTDRLVVGYVGRLRTLGMEKGVATLLHALQALKIERAFFGFIVGGPEEDRREYERERVGLGLGLGTDILFTGEIPARLVPTALRACDILVMPFPDLPHFRLHMSPLKMFEYMASGKPIVTSDLLTVRDVLSEETAVFCKPGDAQSLADALLWVRDHREEALKRAVRAQELAKQHTWEKRMERILRACKERQAEVGAK